MKVICNNVEKCNETHCGHNYPHEPEEWGTDLPYDDVNGPDCTYEGKCDRITVKCVPCEKKEEIDFEIEELFEI